MGKWVCMWGALAGVCTLATVATADERLNSVHSYIVRGRGSSLLNTLSSPRTQAAMVDADDVRGVCEAACRNVLWLYHGDEDQTVEAADLLLDFAAGCFARDDNSADAHLALANAHFMRARIRHIGGGEEGPGKDYAEAVRNYYAAHKLRVSDPESLRWAVLAAMESQRDADTPDPDAARAKAQETVDQLEKKFTLSPAAVHARAAFDLAHAERELKHAKMSKQVAALREMVTNLLTALQPLAQKDIDAGTTYNDAISFIRNNKKKLPLKFDYIFETATEGDIWMSVPHSRRWKDAGRIYQWDREGNILRTIRFDTYRWTMNYRSGHKAIGGDNAKGLCDLGIEMNKESFSKVRRKKTTTKGRLNRAISGCYVYVLQGIDTDGDPLTVRGYYFKSTKRRITHKVAILGWGSQKEMDPAGEFFIRSITEKRPKQKRR